VSAHPDSLPPAFLLLSFLRFVALAMNYTTSIHLVPLPSTFRLLVHSHRVLALSTPLSTCATYRLTTLHCSLHRCLTVLLDCVTALLDCIDSPDGVIYLIYIAPQRLSAS
jgi:hypothetical protein